MDFTEKEQKILRRHFEDEDFGDLLLDIIERAKRKHYDIFSRRPGTDFHETAQKFLIKNGACIALTELSLMLSVFKPDEE